MSRQIDGRVARVLGLDVVGEGWAYPDPEVPGHWNPTSEDHNGNEMQPLFVAHCVCGLLDEPAPWTPPKMLGHYPGCLEVVKFYHTDWAAAEQIVKWMREQGWIIAAEWDSRGCSVWVSCASRYPAWVTGPEFPEALCRAFLEVVGK